MDSTVSVSKGVFVFKKGLKSAPKTNKRARKSKTWKDTEKESLFANQLWYQSYNRLWSLLHNKIYDLNENIFSSVLTDVVDFVKSAHVDETTEIPTAALLTGINMPDHAVQFCALAREIKKHVTPHVAMISSQDSQTSKSLVENTVRCFLDAGDESDDESEENKNKLKKSHYNLNLLSSWYLSESKGTPLVVILPDFEGFQEAALHEFIQIMSFYISKLPFILIFGVATSITTLHKSLPYQVLSKLNVHVFQSRSSTVYLNNILDNIFLTNDCPFHLGGKLFTKFTDIFLFYDLSATGFIQNVKYAMLEHFSTNNARSLCTDRNEIQRVLDQFSHADYECVRQLHSFRALVESHSWGDRIKLLENDLYLKDVLKEKLLLIHDYLDHLHLLLSCLKILVSDLPKTPLGKQLRELYSLAVGSPGITKTPEFKEAFQLLGFQSKDEFLVKIRLVHDLFMQKASFKEFYLRLDELLRELENTSENNMDEEDILAEEMSAIKLDRKQLKEALLLNTKQSKSLTKFEVVKNKILEYFKVELMEKYLCQPQVFVFHEIYFFNDPSIQGNIIGSHRAAIHSALNDPSSYMQCSCCEIPNESAILNTMPDICIAYKLHMEYGKMINLYDWMQAFLCILDPEAADRDEGIRKIDPQFQARFTQCVAELEFLGFVKSSKRKTDHVTRLTWGG